MRWLWLGVLLGVGCTHGMDEDYTELPATNNPYIIQDPHPFGSFSTTGRPSP